MKNTDVIKIDLQRIFHIGALLAASIAAFLTVRDNISENTKNIEISRKILEIHILEFKDSVIRIEKNQSIIKSLLDDIRLQK